MTHDLQKGFTKIGNALRGVQWVYTQIVEEKRKGAFTYPIFFGGGCPLKTSTDTFLRFGQTDHSFFQFLILCSKTCCMYYIVSLVRHVSWCIDFSFLAQANLLSSKARVARRFTARICSSPILSTWPMTPLGSVSAATKKWHPRSIDVMLNWKT